MNHMDDINEMLDILREQLVDAETDLIKKKGARREIKEMKDISDADYEYSNAQVTEAQARITRLERRMGEILSETGV